MSTAASSAKAAKPGGIVPFGSRRVVDDPQVGSKPATP